MTAITPKGPQSLQVLLVDDNPIQLSLLRHLFQRHGHLTIEARNGAEALIVLATEFPDVVVSDCVMPLLDGYQFCRLVKDDRATRHLPVLLLTAQGTGLARFWAKTCGADRFLVKGRDLDHVVEVATALAQQHARPHAAQAVPKLAQENFGVDAIQRRLAMALEQRLIETALRDSVARLYTAEHDTSRLIQGFIEILQELVLPGALMVTYLGEDGLWCHGVHGSSAGAEDRLALQQAVADQGFFQVPPDCHWHPAADEDERRRSLRDPILRVFPASMPGYPVIGALAFITERRAAEDHERLFEIAAEELGRLLSLEDSRLRLYHQAIRDPLTGLYNRKHILDMLGMELDQCGRFGQGVSVMLVDLDHFKAVNDRYGHAAGDQVLGVMAQRMAFGLRKVDQLGRIGGEEFLAYCPQTDLEGTRALAERLREQVATDPIPGLPAHDRVTLSIGLATWEGPEDTPERMLSRADKALYQAKAEGRNRVIG
ncbi:MAG: diguanylate cyclase [Holophagaceae bacterium]|jgi:two-component system cell cycle response regulator|uniref:diguanylate cyclase n=1 Tax=Candidatus Geothrix odensensis TaxID=2954440 RepID=A0A936F1M8_9BACT|nr:diguanylate cyclase [Candidatus Geothrix odensensis]